MRHDALPFYCRREHNLVFGHRRPRVTQPMVLELHTVEEIMFSVVSEGSGTKAQAAISLPAWVSLIGSAEGR